MAREAEFRFATRICQSKLYNMIFKIKNKGLKAVFKTGQGFLVINEGETIEVGDKQVANEMKKHKEIEIREAEPAKIEVPEVKAPNLMPYKIQELRSIAAGKGIEGSIRMTKAQLIKKLEWLL